MQFPTFEEFYHLVYARNPFEWQSHLSKMICEDKWPSLLDLPPASGKSDIVAIYLYSLAYGLKKGQRNVPLRFIYGVPRRTLVDDMMNRGIVLQKKLQDPESPKELQAIAKVIRQALLPESKPGDPIISVGRLRGGLESGTINRWHVNGYVPNMPAIVSTSIDQLGSGILFHGYTLGSKSKPIHAAMMGLDSLIVIDESHECQALLRNLKAVQEMESIVSLAQGIPPTRVMEMSATSTSKTTFPICQELQSRIQTVRPILLVKPAQDEKLEEALAENAQKLLGEGHNVVAVVCNTVSMARRVYRRIHKSEKVVTILLTGRTRGYNRKLIEAYLEKAKVGRDRKDDEPVVFVTTQTLEVGLNLDFDAMVSEAASLDSLIQRFGRLDRIGAYGKAQGVVVLQPKGYKCPIYKNLSTETFSHLSKAATKKVVPNLADVTVDTDLFFQSPEIPVVTKELVQCLAHTHPGSDVNIDGYIHGIPDNANVNFSLIYRSEISNELLREARANSKLADEVKRLLKMARPHSGERLELPRSVLYSPEMVDDSGLPLEADWVKTSAESLRNQLCVRRGDYKIITLGETTKGTEVFVPVSFGRCDQFGWNPLNVSPALDVYDQLHKGRILRLHPFRLPHFDLQKCLKNTDDGSPVLNRNSLLKHLKQIGAIEEAKALQSLQKEDYLRLFTPDHRGVYIYVRNQGKVGSPVKLTDHLSDIEAEVKVICKALSISKELTETLLLAARYHDLGKADPRFQQSLLLNSKFDGKTYLAKSGFPFGMWRKKRCVPQGWRHELQSVAMIIENGLHKDVSDPDLLIHLVASHHGYFRAMYPPIDDPKFRPFTWEGYESNMSYTQMAPTWENFQSLNEKYGFWGLAFLETIIRLADYKVSRA